VSTFRKIERASMVTHGGQRITPEISHEILSEILRG
jgi:hypothetical protein